MAQINGRVQFAVIDDDDDNDEFEDPAGFILLDQPPQLAIHGGAPFPARTNVAVPNVEDFGEPADIDNAAPPEAGPAGAARRQNDNGPPAETSGPMISRHDAEMIMPQILDVIPDVCHKHLLTLLRDTILRKPTTIADAISRALDNLFENSKYPKEEKGKGKGKRKREDEDDHDGLLGGSGKRTNGFNWDDAMDVDGQIEYRSEKAGLNIRRGSEYFRRAMRDLQNTFPLMTIAFIAATLGTHSNLYVPTHLALHRETLLPAKSRSFQEMKVPRGFKPDTALKKGKGKAKSRRYPAKKKRVTFELDENGKPFEVVLNDVEEMDDGGERVYMEEKSWLLQYLREQGDKASMEIIKILEPPEGEGDTECQCCFGDEHLLFMVQCEDGHLFCRDCVERFISNLIGEQKAPAHCMDGSGCKARFTDHELRKALSPNLLNTYHNLIQRKELEAAGIEGLESCPACEYAVVIENEHEKLFICEREDCGLISCRACRKPDHIPKSCEEAAKDSKLDHRHLVEEAMTNALVRYCPNENCKKPFLKDSGCNKITCSNCAQISCYICKKLIKDGYNHFDQTPADYTKARDNKKCRLWDPKTGDPYRDEVAEAREKAQAEALAHAAEAGHEVGEEDVDVALPEARPAEAIPGLGAVQYHVLGGLPAPARYQELLAARGAVPVPGRGAAGVQINHFHFGVPLQPAIAVPPAAGDQRDAQLGHQIMDDMLRNMYQPQPPRRDAGPGARRQRGADLLAARMVPGRGGLRLPQFDGGLPAAPAWRGAEDGMWIGGLDARLAAERDGVDPAAALHDMQGDALHQQRHAIRGHFPRQAAAAREANARMNAPPRGRLAVPPVEPPPGNGNAAARPARLPLPVRLAAPPLHARAGIPREPHPRAARAPRVAAQVAVAEPVIISDDEEDEGPTEDDEMDLDLADDDDFMW